jgi:hypothetical protein
MSVPIEASVRRSGREPNSSSWVGADSGSPAAMCPKLCGGRLRLVDSARWGRYWRCGGCGHECRDSGRYTQLPVWAGETPGR